MKRMFMFYALTALLLVSCNEVENKGVVLLQSANTIKNASLTDKEQNLLNAAAGNMIFTYDYSAEQGSHLEVWVEKYEYGKLIESSGSIGNNILENEEGQILVSINEIPDSKDAIVRMSIVNDTGFSSVNSNMKLPKLNSNVFGSLLTDQEVTLSEEMVIGQISYTNATEIQTGWSDLYNNPTVLANELKDFPVVYFIRCSFKEGGGQEQ